MIVLKPLKKYSLFSPRLVPALLVMVIAIATTWVIPFPSTALSKALSDDIRELMVEKPAAVAAFELIDHQKKPFNNERLKGAWTLMFFGYTHCPDVCPTTLTEVDNAAARLKQVDTGSNKIQYVFVSIDPVRDTPDLLADYISYFGAKFIAATGEAKQLKNLANPLGIRFKVGIGFNKEYIVNHSSSMLLIDPQGRYYARFKAPHYSEEIVTGIKELTQYYGDKH